MANWTYENAEVVSAPEGAYGFVYELIYESGAKYIGQKTIMSERELPALKTDKIRKGFLKKVYHNIIRDEDGKIVVSAAAKRKARAAGAKATREEYDLCEVESDWQSYTGSSKRTPTSPLVSKKILEWAPTKRSLTYLEAKYLFCTDAIISDEYMNDNILGRFYRNSLF